MTKHVVMIVFGALVTPDGSGITMWFIVLPMVLLYICGTYITVRTEKEYVFGSDISMPRAS